MLYRRLFRTYGPQHWWPADSPFEVMVGAVLTQNTAWTNVEQAIANLKSRRWLAPRRIVELHHDALADCLRPSGYFNVKTRRLRNLCEWVVRRGGVGRLQRSRTQRLRAELLGINGIGPETADDILLYAFDRPVFVIDVYTRRLLGRLGWAGGDEDYETMRAMVESALPADVELFKEYHALIVRHGKERCSGEAGCYHCLVEQRRQGTPRM
jgi:endonuclease-3 related protein